MKIKTGFAQWKNSYDVIRWFKDIKNEKNCSFIVLDICEYYPSITRKLLNDSLNWVAGLVEISDDERNIMMSAKRSLLFMDNVAYRKKNNEDFDVTMCSYDKAESSDIVEQSERFKCQFWVFQG